MGHCEFNKDLREKSKIWQFDGYIITAARQRVPVRNRGEGVQGGNGSNGWQNKQINSMQKSKTFAQTQRHKADTTHTHTDTIHTHRHKTHTKPKTHTHTHNTNVHIEA